MPEAGCIQHAQRLDLRPQVIEIDRAMLPQNIELSVGFEAQRYMYRLRPQPGDPNIVGGLLDRYVHAQVRAGWRY